jgi:hypothetical protein
MPTIAIAIIFNTGTYLSYIAFEVQRLIYLVVLVCTFVLPLSVLPFLYFNQKGNKKNSPRQNQILIHSVVLISYLFAFYLLRRMSIPLFLQLFMFASSITVLLSSIISIKWKISYHMISIGAIVGIILSISIRLLIDLQLMLMISILLAGMLGFAQLFLNRHKATQIYFGFGLGLFSILSFMLLY